VLWERKGKQENLVIQQSSLKICCQNKICS
jgi:hypothetical protein